MREKLIELLAVIFHKPLGKTFHERIETIADHLIANGVTVPVGEINFDYAAED